MKLYEIAEQYRAAAEALVANEAPDALEQATAALDAITDAFGEKVERIALLVREFESEADAISIEADRLDGLVTARRNAAARLKDYLRFQMEATGQVKVKGLLCSVAIQQNSRPSIAWVRGLEEIPEPFRRVTLALDGTAAYEAWKAGNLPDGFAVATGSHVRIR